MNGRDKNKKGHYVQQSYLERFSADGKQIFVFDKPQAKSFANSIRDVAQELHFYRLPEELTDENGNAVAIDPLVVEKWFTPIEGEFDEHVSKLVELSGDKRISMESRFVLSEFVALQNLRTRATRNMIIDGTEQFTLAVLEKAILLNLGEEALKYMPKVTYGEEAAKVMQAQMMIDGDFIVNVAEGVAKYCWLLMVNETDQPFYTSDHPVVLHRHIPGRATGMLSRGVEIAFPLSSTRLLSMSDANLYSPDFLANDGSVQYLAPENVEFYNSLQVLQSERQVYCERSTFGLADEMINENPRLSSEKTRRIKVQ